MCDEMVLANEWLHSSVRLCELRPGTVEQPEEEKDLRDAVFNSSSFPLPAYQRSSVLNSLEAYTQALRQAQRGCIAGERKAGINQQPIEPINRFAHSLAGDILQSARGQWGTEQNDGSQPSGPRVGPPCDRVSRGTDPAEMGQREALNCGPSGGPEGLSCTILKSVLEEVAGQRGSQRPRHRSKSAPDPTGRSVEVFGGWRAGCRLEQGSLSCCTHLENHSEVDADMELCDESVPHQSNFKSRSSSKEPPACWFSSSAGGQEAKMEDRSGERCYLGSFPNYGASCSILSPTGLPSKGSLDYPDAPPTTPLLPEMIRSHGSFHRKLKGSLAKEFLPSPPPPTPKHLPCISEVNSLGLRDDRAEFVARLMRSLSLECSERGGLGVEEEWTDGAHSAERCPQEIPRLLAYATQLSANIIGSATISCAADFVGQITRTDPSKWLQFAAEQWANEVMRASLLELMKEEKTGWVESRPPVQGQNMAEKWPANSLYSAMQSDVAVGHSLEDIIPPESSPALKSQSQSKNQVPHVSGTEDLCSFAGQLIADTLVQALAELGAPDLGYCQVQEMAEELCSGIVAEAVITAAQQQSVRWRSPEESCNPNNGRFGAMASISSQPGMTEHAYATSLVEAVVRDSVQEAMRLNMGLTAASAGQDLRLGNPLGSEVRAILDNCACLGVQELQGILLWATASNLGSPTLKLAVQDVQLQTEFSMLGNRARQVGWTVGDLMTSLWQYCKLEDNFSSSGRSLNDASLLKYLQEKLVGEMTG